MAGIEFSSKVPREKEDAVVVARNTRIGLKLFAVYVALYGGFMALSAFAPKRMGEIRIGGVNLAIVYGFGLILTALLLALLYLWLCRTVVKDSTAKPNS
ncbi:MAG: DUF485 domain-containing protein [Planctomycetota bacterium]